MAQTKGRGLWASAASYFAGTVGLQALNFLAQPLFANLMPPSEMAHVAVFLFWSTLLSLIIGMQVGSGLNNVISVHGRDAVHRHLNSYINASTMLALIIGVLLAVAPDQWTSLTGLSRPYLLLAVASGWCLAVVNSALSRAIALSRPATYVKVNAGVVLGAITLGLALMWLMPDQLALGRILGYVGASLAVAILFLIRLPWRPTHRIRAHLAFAVTITSPLLLHEVLSLLINQSSRVFLLHSVGSEQTGVFTFSWAMGGVALLAGAALNNAWLPWYFERMDAGGEAEILSQGRRVIWLMGTATPILILISPDILLFVDAEYAGGAALIPVAAAVGLLGFLFNHAANYVIYCRRTKLLLFASIPAAAINLGLNSALVPLFGNWGAATAIAAANLFLAGATIVLNLLVLKGRHLAIGSIAAVVGVAGMSLAATQLLLPHIAARWVLAGLLGLIAVAAFARHLPSLLGLRRP